MQLKVNKMSGAAEDAKKQMRCPVSTLACKELESHHSV